MNIKFENAFEKSKDVVAWIIASISVMAMAGMAVGFLWFFLSLLYMIGNDIFVSGIHSDGLKFALFLFLFFICTCGVGASMKWAFDRIGR